MDFPPSGTCAPTETWSPAIACCADLYGADLAGATLIYAMLFEADLRLADLRGADLS